MERHTIRLGGSEAQSAPVPRATIGWITTSLEHKLLKSDYELFPASGTNA